MSIVRRSQLAAMQDERDEWRRRAEATRPRARKEIVFLRNPLWVRLTSAAWLVLFGLLAGGAAIPRANDEPTLEEDYPACIAAAREASPPEADRYRELVDALRACGVYGRS